MDAVESNALRTLSERAVWPINELPGWIDADVLRCLDADGLVEARYVTAVNDGRNEDGTCRTARSPSQWFSPIQRPELAGGWNKIAEVKPVDCSSYPNEVRVSERGRAVLAKALRSDPLSSHSGPDWDAARAAASSFRQTRAGVFPGMLVAVRSQSFPLHAVRDAEFGQAGEAIFGCAVWGASAEFQLGTAAVEVQGESVYAPVVIGDRSRPTTSVPQIDAWIARTDVLRKLMDGSAGSCGPLPLSKVQLQAAAWEILNLIREGAMSLVKAAPDSVRPHLAPLIQVADSAAPTVEQLDTAIRSLMTISPEWRATPVEPLSDTNRAALEELLRVPSGEGLTAKQVVARLAARKPPILIEEITFRKHVVPVLRPLGLKNSRGVGYYIDPSRRPAE